MTRHPHGWTALFCAAGICAARPAEPPVRVYPTPRAMQVQAGTVTAAPGTRIEGAGTADADAVRMLRGLLAGGGAAEGPGELVVYIGEKDDAAVRPYAADIAAKSGAYRLVVSRERIVLAGFDGRGTFYAVQTLRQLLGYNGTPGALPLVEINDAPEIEFRGTVEGFYGTPWTHENRKAQFEFYGRHKMNTYIYGPKDDPYHRAPNWRKPYPPPDAERIRELVRVAASNKVDFVWAIHPGGDIRWTEADARAVLDKFEAMYALGVRSFSVFFDDIGGEGTNPERQAELLNRIQREFVRAKGDVTPLVLCPTQYNKGWSSGDYLDILGTRLDPSIHVMWTGNSVVADIDRATMEWINARLRRKAYIWWNFPVTDYVRNHLLMGPAYGNGPDIGPMVSGFVSNPMERAEASKVALYGVAGFTWNPPAYDAQAAWESAMREVMPRAADDFRVFCAHNSDLGPNYHGYRRAESAEIQPVIRRFMDAYRNGTPDPAAGRALASEFARIATAPAAIRAGSDHPRLMEEIGPWLDAFEQLGRAGQGALAMTAATNNAAAWNACASAAGALERMAEIDRKNNRNPHQPGIRTGSLVLDPFVRELVQRGGARLYSTLGGTPAPVLSPLTNSGTRDGLERMTDADPESYYYSRQIQKVGDVFGLDLGLAVPVRHVRLSMGRKDGDHDIVHQGQMEATADGKTWAPLGPVTAGERVEWRGEPVRARQVRYRVIRAGKLDGSKNDVWTAIRDFQVNPVDTTPRVRSSVAAWEKAPLRTEGNAHILAPQFEVVSLRPGQMLGLEFPVPVAWGRLEADLAADPAGWLRAEYYEEGAGWKPLRAKAEGTKITSDAAGVQSRAVCVRNAGATPRDVRLSAFRVERTPAESAGATAAWTDGKLETSAPLAARQEIPIPATARGVVLLVEVGGGQKVKVGWAPSAGAPVQPLASRVADLAELPLASPGGRLVLETANSGVRIHEILWRDRPPKPSSPGT